METIAPPQAARRTPLRTAILALSTACAAARARWKRPACPASTFAVLAAAIAVLLNNRQLFSLIAQRADLASAAGLALLFTAFLLITGMVALFLLVFGHQYTLKPLAIATFVLSAILGYFTREFGTVYDMSMIRNILDTFREGNSSEGAELFSMRLAAHVALLGALPSVLALSIRVTHANLRRELLLRALHAGGLALLAGLLLAANLRYVTYFSREHGELRYYATPTFAVNSLRKVAMRAWFGGRAPFVEIGTDAVRRKPAPTRVIGVLVVGETARADHFSLNGYPRRTNPRLARRATLNFTHVESSGTSTAHSLPCMFSFLGRRNFTTEAAARQSNVLDVLARTGVTIAWIENNSGPKAVCDRLGYDDLRARADPGSPLYNDGGYYDEALIDAARRRIDESAGDLLLVLHMMGSHGPAYYRRYPPAFDVFTPTCRDSSPQRSSVEAVVNAYDNTILYTDYVLDRLLDLLVGRDESTFLIYVSDHGESLGENGLYLHGMPRMLAPPEQTHVPLIAWLSPRFRTERSLDVDALRARTSEPRSHDDLPHSLLGLFDVTTSLYRADLDLFRSR